MLGSTLKPPCCVQRYVVDVTEETSSQLPGYVAPQRVEAAPEVRGACSLRALDGGSSLRGVRSAEMQLCAVPGRMQCPLIDSPVPLPAAVACRQSSRGWAPPRGRGLCGDGTR